MRGRGVGNDGCSRSDKEPKPGPAGTAAALILTPLELLARLALVPPPRVQLGEPTALPRIAPARGPPLWEPAEAEDGSPPDPALQPAPAYEFDQRLTW